MGTEGWTSLIVFQSLAVMFNMLLLNNITDKNFIYLGLMIMVVLKFAIESAIFDEVTVLGQGSFSFSFVFAIIIAVIFMYINKRVHKEVFIEHKQKIQQQGEFKTIFDNLDEGILILEDELISQVNRSLKKFISKFFGLEMMQKISQCDLLSDQNEMNEQNEKATKCSKKCKNFFSYLCCWRLNQ